MLPSRVTPSAAAAANARAHVSSLGTARSDSAGECFATLSICIKERVRLLRVALLVFGDGAMYADRHFRLVRPFGLDESAELFRGDLPLKGPCGVYTVRHSGAQDLFLRCRQGIEETVHLLKKRFQLVLRGKPDLL